MSADGFHIAADAELLAALLAALKNDAGVKAAFGTPLRIFDDETRAAQFPYAYVDRFETRPVGSALHAEAEHRITLAVYSRHGGREEARELTGALRAAVENASFSLTGQRVVLCHVVYADVLRTSDLRSFRSLVRVRIATEGAG